jgi:hypothetical protein
MVMPVRMVLVTISSNVVSSEKSFSKALPRA